MLLTFIVAEEDDPETVTGISACDQLPIVS